MKAIRSGYKEIQHTADLAIKVWSVTPEGLFAIALEGMYQLMGVSSNILDETKKIKIELFSLDLESLLVSFLSECLFFYEINNWLLIPEELSIVNNNLIANMRIQLIISLDKEIKAVTFHNLEINQKADGLSTILIFDV